MRERRLAAWLAAGASLGWYLHHTLPLLGATTFDDAYMFVRYAKHYLDGFGFVWNIGGGPAYGATSTLHLLVVTAVRAVTDWSDAMVLTAISFSAGLAAAALLTVLGFLVLDRHDRRREWLPWLVLPLIVLPSTFRAHSFSGMDTTLSMLCNSLLVVAVVFYCRRPSAFRMAACIAAGYVTVLARPDNGVYATLFPPLFFIAGDRKATRSAALYASLLGCVLAGDLLLKRWSFGTALPLPFYAKQSGAYLGYLGAAHWNPVTSTLDFIFVSLPFLVVAVAAAGQQALPTIGAIVVPVAITLAYFFSVMQIMGNDARYQYPSLPFAVLVGLVAVRDHIKTPEPAARVGLRVTAIALTAILAIGSPVRAASIRAWERWFIGQPTGFEPQRQYATRSRLRLPELGWWESIVDMTAFVNALPRDTVLAASEYGYLGAEHPEIQIVDLVGLHDSHFAKHGFSADWVFAAGPDVVWLPHQDYSFAITQLIDAPVFAQDYEYYPRAYNYGVALRKRSPRYAAVRAAFSREFMRVYGARPEDYLGEMRGQ